jgi:hypothetical protein
MHGVPEALVSFSGRVECRRQAGGPLALTLIGRSADSSRSPCQLSFQGLVPPDLPPYLDDVAVQRLGADRYRIAGSGQEWTVAARKTYLQRDVGAAFYRAIPPRQPPLARRMFFRIVLTLAGTSLGRRLLARRRG